MPTLNAHLAAELTVESEKWPVFVRTIDHPAGRVLVDTGMIDVRPEVDDMSPTPHPENIPRDIACVMRRASRGVAISSLEESRAQLRQAFEVGRWPSPSFRDGDRHSPVSARLRVRRPRLRDRAHILIEWRWFTISERRSPARKQSH